MREGGGFPELRKTHVCQLIESGRVVQRRLGRDNPYGQTVLVLLSEDTGS